jgi:hypothetical protein
MSVSIDDLLTDRAVSPVDADEMMITAARRNEAEQQATLCQRPAKVVTLARVKALICISKEMRARNASRYRSLEVARLRGD